jgi:hypothetical protein
MNIVVETVQVFLFLCASLYIESSNITLYHNSESLPSDLFLVLFIQLSENCHQLFWVKKLSFA